MKSTEWKQLFTTCITYRDCASGKEPTCQETQVQSLVSERSPGDKNGNPLKYSFLKNSMDRGAWCAMVRKESDKPEQLTHNQYRAHIQNT